MREQDSSEPPAQSERDTVTLGLLRGGDPDGLQRLMLDHAALIRSRLRRDFGRVLDDSELDEAMGTMTVKVWHAAPRFDPEKGTLRAWMLVIARNCALRILEGRRRFLLRSDHDLDALAIDVSTVASGTDRHRIITDLQQCIAALPALQRAILEADLEMGGVAPAESLAARLGTSANSIYVSRLKARKSLRLAMQAKGHSLGLPSTSRAPTANAKRRRAAPNVLPNDMLSWEPGTEMG